jgi:hypothetical protein
MEAIVSFSFRFTAAFNSDKNARDFRATSAP